MQRGERNILEKKHNQIDAANHDKKVEDDHENEERNENHEIREKAKTSKHKDETIKLSNEETGVRKSSRIQKRRMIITDDEIGDCDDENDPDYIR